MLLVVSIIIFHAITSCIPYLRLMEYRIILIGLYTFWSEQTLNIK